MLPRDGVGGQRTAGVRLQQRDRHAHFIGQIVVVQEIGRIDDLPHGRLEFGGLRIRPVVVPALQIIRADTAGLKSDAADFFRQLAGMAARATSRAKTCFPRDESASWSYSSIPPGASFRLCGLGGGEEEAAPCPASGPQSPASTTNSSARVGDLDRARRRWPPMQRMKCSSHSSLNRPMLRYTRLSAPSAPTESEPSLSTRGVKTVSAPDRRTASAAYREERSR